MQPAGRGRGIVSYSDGQQDAPAAAASAAAAASSGREVKKLTSDKYATLNGMRFLAPGGRPPATPQKKLAPGDRPPATPQKKIVQISSTVATSADSASTAQPAAAASEAQPATPVKPPTTPAKSKIGPPRRAPKTKTPASKIATNESAAGPSRSRQTNSSDDENSAAVSPPPQSLTAAANVPHQSQTPAPATPLRPPSDRLVATQAPATTLHSPHVTPVAPPSATAPHKPSDQPSPAKETKKLTFGRVAFTSVVLTSTASLVAMLILSQLNVSKAVTKFSSWPAVQILNSSSKARILTVVASLFSFRPFWLIRDIFKRVFWKSYAA